MGAGKTAAISAAIEGNNGVTVNGIGTVSFSGANGYTGTTSVLNGTLMLDYSTNNNSKISSNLSIGNNGTLLLVGNAAPFTQTVTLNPTPGNSAISFASGRQRPDVQHRCDQSRQQFNDPFRPAHRR